MTSSGKRRSTPFRAGACLLLVALCGPGWSAGDAGQKALQQHQLQRQQQQDQLQLRMQQHQRGAQNPLPDVRGRLATEQLEINQQLRQQQLHQQQQREQLTRPEMPSDDPGTRSAKAQLERQRAEAESRRQLRQFDWERQDEGGKRKAEPIILPGAMTPSPGQHAPQ